MFVTPLLNQGGVFPPLDGRTPVFVELGADPSVGGFDAPIGSIARFGTTYLWKVGSSTTAWVLLNANNFLNDTEIETIAPSTGTDATFTIPPNTDAILIQGKCAITMAALASNLRFNGNAADREVSCRWFTDGATPSGPTVQGTASVEMDTPLNSFEAFVICTGAVKIARVTTAWYRDAATDLGGYAAGAAFWFNAAVLTSFVLRLNAGAFSASGTKLTSRKIVLP